jgi:hypothetical protein
VGNESWGGFIGFNLRQLKVRDIKEVESFEFLGVFRILIQRIAYSHILLICTHFN